MTFKVLYVESNENHGTKATSCAFPLNIAPTIARPCFLLLFVSVVNRQKVLIPAYSALVLITR